MALDYWLITLMAVVNKIPEKTFRVVLMKFLLEKNIIFSTQHGFKSNCSCLTNLLDFIHSVYT